MTATSFQIYCLNFLKVPTCTAGLQPLWLICFGSNTCLKLQYLLTSCCRVLLEQLTGLQLVKKFPAFHGTRRFITALTSVRHLYLPWASPIQSIYPHPTSWRSILNILFANLMLLYWVKNLINKYVLHYRHASTAPKLIQGN